MADDPKHLPIPFPEGDPSTWPSIIYDEETPEDHLANAEAAEAIGLAMEAAGVETLGQLVERFPGMNPEEIRREVAITKMREALRQAAEAEAALRQVDELLERASGDPNALVRDYLDGGPADV